MTPLLHSKPQIRVFIGVALILQAPRNA